MKIIDEIGCEPRGTQAHDAGVAVYLSGAQPHRPPVSKGA